MNYKIAALSGEQIFMSNTFGPRITEVISSASVYMATRFLYQSGEGSIEEPVNDSNLVFFKDSNYTNSNEQKLVDSIKMFLSSEYPGNQFSVEIKTGTKEMNSAHLFGDDKFQLPESEENQERMQLLKNDGFEKGKQYNTLSCNDSKASHIKVPVVIITIKNISPEPPRRPQNVQPSKPKKEHENTDVLTHTKRV